MSRFNKIKRHSLLITSLTASVGLHAFGLYFLVSHPMMLRHTLCSLFGLSITAPQYLDTQDEEAIAKKNQLIEEVFEQILVMSPRVQQPFDLVELPRGIAIAPSEEMADPFQFTPKMSEPSPLWAENWSESVTLICQNENESLPEVMLTGDGSFSFRPEMQFASTIGSYDIDQLALPLDEGPYIIDPIAANPSNSIASEELEASPAHLSEPLLARSFPNRLALEIDEKMVELDTSFGTHKLSEQVPFLAHPPLSKMHMPRIHIPFSDDDFDEYIPTSIATTTEWNDDFDLDISFLPHPDGKGYIFSLVLNPNFDISQYSLKHDVLFIIDRSVRKHRFEVYKRAVVKALSSLQQGDTFNIYIVDKKMTRFNTKSLPVTQKAIRAAEYFLEKQSDDLIFSQGDVYSSLEKILPEVQSMDSVHSAILITDGMSQLSTKKQQLVLKNWIEKNNGKLGVYTAAVGPKNDLLMLDLLSSVSGGKLLWSDTHASFPRKLAKLVLDLRDPVASDLIVDAIPIQSEAKISLAPTVFQAPVLFSHQPYVVLGSIDQPGPFDLIIQGRHRDQWIAIKKTVSFVDGAKGDRSLLNLWSSQKAHRSYTKFLNDGKPSYLKEAKEILKKSRSEVAFE